MINCDTKQLIIKDKNNDIGDDDDDDDDSDDNILIVTVETIATIHRGTSWGYFTLLCDIFLTTTNVCIYCDPSSSLYVSSLTHSSLCLLKV
jgi:hypothetical protein